MIPLAAPFRQARADDGPALARFVDAAGEGLPLAVWTALAAPGEDPWARGAARQAERAVRGESVVIDAGDGRGAVAGLTGYPIRAGAEAGADMPAPFRPLQALENLAAGTWYVMVLAALPEARGLGHGTRLLRLAERAAAAEGLDALSLIVSDDNAGARRLYARVGFEEVARRPMAGGLGWTPPGEDWILMIKRGPFA